MPEAITQGSPDYDSGECGRLRDIIYAVEGFREILKIVYCQLALPRMHCSKPSSWLVVNLDC